jgi:hypothetical protein
MFEQSLQPKKWKDQQAAEGRSPGEVECLRIAAVIIAANAVLSFFLSFAAKAQGIPVLFALALSWYLFKLRPRAESLAIGLAIIGAVLGPIVYFWRFPFFPALLQSAASWGVNGAILLLLIGEPGVLRRAVAIGAFVVLSGGVFALSLLGLLFQKT